MTPLHLNFLEAFCNYKYSDAIWRSFLEKMTKTAPLEIGIQSIEGINSKNISFLFKFKQITDKKALKNFQKFGSIFLNNFIQK
jgi:hypothetical protein